MATFYNKITTVILLSAIVLTVKSFKITKVDKSFTPHWVSLCGHQYLFSEEMTIGKMLKKCVNYLEDTLCKLKTYMKIIAFLSMLRITAYTVGGGLQVPYLLSQGNINENIFCG